VKSIGDFDMLQTLYPDAVCISAKTGMGLDGLSECVAEKFRGTELLLRIGTSQANGKVQSFLRAYGTIISEEYDDGNVLIDARLGRNQLPGLKRLRPDKLEIINTISTL